MQIADGGGGGSSFDVDIPAAESALGKIVGAAETIDTYAGQVPAAVDAGLAQGVLSDIVALFGQASGKLAEEAGLVSDVGSAMLTNYGDLDAAVAEVMAGVVASLEAEGAGQ